MMKRILPLALIALALAMQGSAAAKTGAREPGGPDDRGVLPNIAKSVTVDRICTLIAAEAKANAIPPEFH